MKYSHGFLGLGNMASVLLASFLEQKLIQPQKVIASRRSAKALKKLQAQFKIKTTTDNQELASSVDFLWLGIKPFQAREVLKTITPALSPKTAVLSMMAGISLRQLRKFLPKKTLIIRLMPNTPTRLGLGMTGIYFPPQVSPKTQRDLLKLLKATGEVYQVKKESELDAVTALSGSGPAFVYYLAQAFIQGGRSIGLSEKASRNLSYQTFQGALGMLQKSKLSPEELIQQVLSPKGTTEAGIKFLEKSHVALRVSQSIQKAFERAQKIGKEN